MKDINNWLRSHHQQTHSLHSHIYNAVLFNRAAVEHVHYMSAKEFFDPVQASADGQYAQALVDLLRADKTTVDLGNLSQEQRARLRIECKNVRKLAEDSLPFLAARLGTSFRCASREL